MNAKISKEEIEKNYNWKLSDEELIEKYFYKKDALWNEFIWKEGFESQNFSLEEKENLINEFKSYEILKSKNEFWLIDLTLKAKEKFKKEQFIDEVFIIEPYTFFSIWKTKFWYDMHKAKWDSDIKVIKNFAKIIYEIYLKLNEKYRFDAIWFIPPTLKWRKIQIMNFIKDYFLIQNDNLKILDIIKIDWTPSQKSLRKFDERRENAKNSFMIGNRNKEFWNILLIDDAIWSGTTLNYVAEKIKKQNKVEKIVWLAIVGSMRWFDVIREI